MLSVYEESIKPALGVQCGLDSATSFSLNSSTAWLRVWRPNPEVFPLRSSSAGQSTRSGVNITINVSGADRHGLRKVTEEKIVRYMISMIDSNRPGTHVSLLKAQRLVEPGKF